MRINYLSKLQYRVFHNFSRYLNVTVLNIWNSSDGFMHKCNLELHCALLKTNLRDIGQLYKELHYFCCYYYFVEGCGCTEHSTFCALRLRLLASKGIENVPV